MKLGLTLSGGGARGAYEAGVVRALAEENVKLHAVSGASIGALNGALVAASPTLSEAADRLEHLWKELGEIELLKEMIDIKLIAAAGARLIIPSPIRFVAGYLYQLLVGKNELFAEFDNNGLLTNKPLRDILNTWISDDALEAGIPLHVSVYEKYSTPQALLAAISSVSGYGDTPHSRYRCLQDMPRHLHCRCFDDAQQALRAFIDLIKAEQLECHAKKQIKITDQRKQYIKIDEEDERVIHQHRKGKHHGLDHQHAQTGLQSDHAFLRL